MHVRADHTGTYRGFCAEFCGLQHTHMQFFVVADPPDVFRTWVANQAKPAPPDADPEGRATFERLTCAGCHAVRGTAARGTYGPDLTHLANRQTLAAGTVPNDRAHLSEWVQDAQAVKKGALMPTINLAPADLQAVLTYLGSLG
jgi:cytochrome c oxidase subunit 2